MVVHGGDGSPASSSRVANRRSASSGSIGARWSSMPFVGTDAESSPLRVRNSDRMSKGPHDIGSRADCERLVRSFYGRALEDPIIGFIFVDVAKLDLKAHLPGITS